VKVGELEASTVGVIEGRRDGESVGGDVPPPNRNMVGATVVDGAGLVEGEGERVGVGVPPPIAVVGARLCTAEGAPVPESGGGEGALLPLPLTVEGVDEGSVFSTDVGTAVSPGPVVDGADDSDPAGKLGEGPVVAGESIVFGEGEPVGAFPVVVGTKVPSEPAGEGEAVGPVPFGADGAKDDPVGEREPVGAFPVLVGAELSARDPALFGEVELVGVSPEADGTSGDGKAVGAVPAPSGAGVTGTDNSAHESGGSRVSAQIPATINPSNPLILV